MAGEHGCSLATSGSGLGAAAGLRSAGDRISRNVRRTWIVAVIGPPKERPRSLSGAQLSRYERETVAYRAVVVSGTSCSVKALSPCIIVESPCCIESPCMLVVSCCMLVVS
jgi:hypothetical protein